MNLAPLLMFTLLTGSPSAAQQREIHKIEGRLMAPCCYTQTIDVHESEIAQQMRGEVTAMVMNGQSEQKIIDYYKAEYGVVILVVPDGISGTLAYSIPLCVTLLAALALMIGIARTVLASRRIFEASQVLPDDPVLLAYRTRIRNEWDQDF